MKISEKYPPNYDEIVQALGKVDGAVFCYGDTIYNPFKRNITPDIEVHEAVHMKQQGNMPEVWYMKYLYDPKFRLEQEIQAYGEQYAFIKKYMKGDLLAWGLEKMAQALSGKEYGNLLSYNEAEAKIRLASKNVV